MADISDVLSGVVQTLAAAFYPNGTAQPSAIGAAAKLYPGWPTASQLDADLVAGTVHVTAYPLATERAESAINLDAVEISVTAAGTVLTVNGATVTVSGTPTVGDVACIEVNRTPHAYAIQAGDTQATVAAALAALIPGATAAQATVTVGGLVWSIAAAVSTPASMLQPMRRISRSVQLSVWAPTPALRDAGGKLVDYALWQAERLAMPDGTSCGLSYLSAPVNDAFQKERLYRRDLILRASFMESAQQTAQTVANLALGVATPAVSAVNFNTGA